MSIIKGDIKKAIGYGTIQVGDIEIDLSSVSVKDLVSFQELPIKITKGKPADKLTSEDLLEAGKLSTDWYVNFFMSKDESLNKDDIEHFVVKNKQVLQKEFTIGLGLKTRASYDKDEADAIAKLEKNE